MKSLKGKRYIALLRCSTANQSEKSIPDQRALVEAFAAEIGLIHIGDEILEGLSGSKPALRKDIAKLLERKRTENDFDLIVVHDLSRFTRGGSLHGRHVEAEFAKLGVEILSATDTIPTGSGVAASMLRSFYYDMAHEGAKQMGQKSVRGWSSSVLNQQITPIRIPPYGIDKLYVSLDGKTKFHILRNMPDGTQVRLHPDTQEVLATYAPAQGHCGFYKKQANEKVILIPSSPERVEVVRRVYRHYFVDGWGYGRIANALNSEGVPTAKGRMWQKDVIKNMIENPVYCGRIIACRQTAAWHYSMGKDGPVEVEADQHLLLTQVRKPMLDRPKEDWIEFHSDELSNYLDPDIKKMAQARQSAYEDGSRRSLAGSYGRDKHITSNYILKGILHLRQGNIPMRGHTVSSKRVLQRYYRPRNATASSHKGTVRACFIPAEPLETAVLDVLGKIFESVENLRPKLRDFLKAEQSVIQSKISDLPSMIQERKLVARKLSATLDLITGLDGDEFSEKVLALREKLNDFDKRIGDAGQTPEEAEDVDVVVAAVMGEFAAVKKLVETGAVGPLKRLLSVLISELSIDGETREASLSVSLPSWALTTTGKLIEKVCLERGIDCYPSPKANNVLLAQVKIWHEDKYRKTKAKSWRFCASDGIIPLNHPETPKVPANLAAFTPQLPRPKDESGANYVPQPFMFWMPFGDVLLAVPDDTKSHSWPIGKPLVHSCPIAA